MLKKFKSKFPCPYKTLNQHINKLRFKPQQNVQLEQSNIYYYWSLKQDYQVTNIERSETLN